MTEVTLRRGFFVRNNLVVDAEDAGGGTNEFHWLLQSLGIDKSEWDDIEEVTFDASNVQIEKL